MSKSFSIISSPYAFIATLFGVGAIPFAPGTWGSFVALLAYLFITIYFGLSLLDVILITLIVVFLYVWICEKATARLRDEDKDVKSIVIDEFSGLWVACIPASSFLMPLKAIFQSMPWTGVILFVGAIGWKLGRWRLALTVMLFVFFHFA